MAYTPKTEMGKKMMALREKAVAEGMTLLDEDEITGEDMVMVRREDLEFMQQNIDRVARCFRTVLSPDSPASQFLGIIEKMREKGFEFILSFCGPGYEAEFTSGDKEFYGRAATLTEAVSLAARAALTAPE